MVSSIGIYHNKVSLTQIIAIGELEINGKVKKRTTKKGQSKEISTSTLVVASDGTFNQQTASICLKKSISRHSRGVTKMKKQFLTLLLLICSFVSFGQEKIALVKSSTPTQVGDTLVIDVKYQGSAGTAKLTQFDFQYNNKLLALQSRTWKLTSTSAQKAYNSWNGYKWGNNTATTDIDGEYADYVAGSTVYGTNADWSVERVTIQDVTAFANNDEWIQYRFTIKDKGSTNYSDYSNLINLNWGYLKEADGTAVAVDGEVNGGTSLTLTGIQGESCRKCNT